MIKSNYKQSRRSNFKKGDVLLKALKGIRIYATSYSHEITGSNTVIIAKFSDEREVRFLIDFGIFQEKKWKDYNGKNPYNMEKIDFGIITHAHADHIGQFPRLQRSYFDGLIYCSKETKAYLPIMLNEVVTRLIEEQKRTIKSNKIEKENRKKEKRAKCGSIGKKDHKRGLKGKTKKQSKYELKSTELLYSKDDAKDFVRNVKAVKMETTFSPKEGVKVTFYPNGHVSGSVITIVDIYDETETITLCITGDLGLKNELTGMETYLPTEVVNRVSFVICESTYGGDTEKLVLDNEDKKLEEVIKRAYDEGKRIVVPSYAFEKPMSFRQQLDKKTKDSSVSEYLQTMPVFFDTKLGIKFQEKMEQEIPSIKEYKPFKLVTTPDMRNMVKSQKLPYILVCTSARMNQGSILSYLEFLEDKNTIILFYCGYIPSHVQNYMALPKGKEIQIHGKIVKLNAEFEIVKASAHMDRKELIEFLLQFKNVKAIFFHHGTNSGKQSLVDEMTQNGIVAQNLLYSRTVKLNKFGIQKIY